MFELSEEAYKEPWAQGGKGTNVNTKEEALKEAKEFYDAELADLEEKSEPLFSEELTPPKARKVKAVKNQITLNLLL